MKKGPVFFRILLGVLLGNAASESCAQKTADAHTDSALNLDELIAEALQANPDIAAVQKKRDALRERSPQSRVPSRVPHMPHADTSFCMQQHTC
jgi:hypothetical protein